MTEIMARANLAALIPTYDSKAEEWWAQYGPLLMADELKQPVELTQYHALTFHLPGGSYTPDFLHILADGTQVQVEVKALIVGRDGKPNNHVQKGYRDARSKLRAAADVFRWLTWYEVRVGARGAFELERIDP
jgi:hypothetical protein